MASIHKRNGGFRVMWRDPDGAPRSRQCPDKRTADELAKEVEQDVARGRRWEPRDLRPPPDLRTIGRAWLTSCAALGQHPRTVIWSGQVLEVFCAWLEGLADVSRLEPAVLTRARLEAYHGHLLVSGQKGTRTRSTARKHIQAIERWWAWASGESDEYGELMPVPKRLRLPAVAPPATLAPTWAEVDAAIGELAGLPPQRLLAVIMRFTGLRTGQGMRLVWDDVDLERATLHVRPELGKSLQEKTGRHIPISRHLVAELEAWPGPREGFIVPTWRLETGPRARVARARDFARAWRRAKVRPAVWQKRPQHCFRKAFRSELKRAGADSEAVDFLIGHAAQGQRGIYTDPDALPLREAVSKVPPLRGVLLSMEGGRAG